MGYYYLAIWHGVSIWFLQSLRLGSPVLAHRLTDIFKKINCWVPKPNFKPKSKSIFKNRLILTSSVSYVYIHTILAFISCFNLCSTLLCP